LSIRHIFSCALTCLILASSGNASSNPNIKNIEYFLDQNNTFTQHSVVNKIFEISQLTTLNFGFYQGTVWIKLNLENLHEMDVLELKNSNLDIIEYFILEDQKFVSTALTGDHFVFSKRPIENRFFDFPLQNNNTVLLRIQNFGDQLFIPITVKKGSDLAKSEYYEQLIFGIYYGLCLFAFLLNVFIYAKIRERSNLFYSLYLVGIVLLQLALDGHGFQYIWSNNVFFAKHAPPLMASLSVLFLILFTQAFLNIKSILPISNKIFTGIAVLVGANVLLSLFTITYPVAVLQINVLTLLLNILILPVAFVAFKRKFKPAKFFLLAFSLLIVSVFVFILRNFGLISSNVFTDYSLQIGSTAEVVLLSFAIVDKFNSYKEEALTHLKEINKIQTEQTERLELEVVTRTERITEQKNQLEEKNKEIIDSINYAKRIQNALIPSIESIEKLLPDSFVLWEPKDIVSGDFYWVSEVTTTKENTENSNLILFSVGDCTGHGVPGAIISVLGLKILNLSKVNRQINTTADALSYLNNEFVDTFQNDQGEGIGDGMDIGFCALNPSTLQLYFSGAKNGVYIVRENELIELKGTKNSIGTTANVQFDIHQFQLQQNDCVYLYSDGFADQFGGPKNKKFKYQALKQLLIDHHRLSMTEQRLILKQTFTDWKGDYEQTDDVCVFGVRV